MCGICGIYNFGISTDVLSDDIARMNHRLEHRGPDDHGIHQEDLVALGHRRLSIIDIAGGKQPMVDPRGYIVVYNGEIYNFQTIREELIQKGEFFKTNSDTEVLLKSYIQWGCDCVAKFNGMFAFAIYNRNEKSLFLARDRLGIKPLYYSKQCHGIAFASEIPALLECRKIKKDVSCRFMPFYLTHRYFPREHTAYEHIQALLPGNWLYLKDHQFQKGRYWDLEDIYRNNKPESFQKTDEEELKDLIRDAITLRRISDVPIGTFLSGGIDSGIITSELASIEEKTITSFTVGFHKDPKRDETKLAGMVAKRYETNHHEHHMSPDDLLEYGLGLLDRFGQPFGDSSLLPTFAISKIAREKVKVILSGDGGDEQFGGYDNYRRYLLLKNLPAIPGGKFLGSVFGSRAAKLSRLTSEPAPFLYRRLSAIIEPERVSALAGDMLKPHLVSPDFDQLTRRDPQLGLDGIMLHDLMNYMINDVLQKVDMMSMANGLEVRVPLLDHRIVEKAVTIPWKHKVSFSQTKILLRRLYKEALPEKTIKGIKTGFAIPINRWFRGPLKDAAHDILLSKSAGKRGLLNADIVENILRDHTSGKRQNGHIIWNLVALEKWAEKAV